MPYLINRFNGQPLVTLQDGVLDSTTNLGLVGRNFAGYGEIQNENFLWLLENFAGEEPPGRPISGQLWYNTAKKNISVYTGTQWNVVGNAVVSNTAPAINDAATGDTWLDSSTNQLYVFNGTSWKFVGPEAAEGFGITRLVSGTIKDNAEVDTPVIKITVNDAVIGIIADRDFTISNSTPVTGFTNLYKGVNLSFTSVLTGSLKGNADTADKLKTPVNINGTAFDGSQNITVKAETLNQLTRGNYLVGNNFTGASEVTWAVDATPNNVDNKVVARDDNGNFSAGTITADLVGNVQGNVEGNVSGNLFGNALTATKFENPVTINDVEFDGSENITVRDTTKVFKTGDTMSGHLTLNANPIDPLHAAPKQYVDSLGVPIGAIIMWSGNFIPTGWALCDGSNGTPDLRNRFIFGAATINDVNAAGGNSTATTSVAGTHNHSGLTGGTALTVDQMPAHTHSLSSAISTSGSNVSVHKAFNAYGSINATGSTGGSQPHTHSINTDGGHSHTVSTLPPYYTLAFIIKVS